MKIKGCRKRFCCLQNLIRYCLIRFISNVASASRGIVGKEVLKKPPGKNMDARNLYAVMTILSATFCLPVALILESKAIIPTIQALIGAGTDKKFYWEIFLKSRLDTFRFHL